MFYPFGYGVHNSVGARAAAYCDNAVIGIAHVAQSSVDKFLIKLVEHHVAQQGREVATLRCAEFRCFIHSIFHNARFQILAYQTFGVWVMDYSTNVTHQLVLRHIIEELLQINVHYPLVALV